MRLAKRPLLILLAGIVAFVSSMVLHTHSAFAYPPGCEVAGEQEDVVYGDWHNSTSEFVNDGPYTHWVDIDLWTWHINHSTGSGVDPKCYRAYYASTWTADGSIGNFTASLRTWICKSYNPNPGPAFLFQNITVTGNRNDVATDADWGSGINLQRVVTLPSGSDRILHFANYGAFPIENGCLPQADTTDMQAGWNTWSPPVLTSAPAGTIWYCHDRNGPQGWLFYCP